MTLRWHYSHYRCFRNAMRGSTKCKKLRFFWGSVHIRFGQVPRMAILILARLCLLNASGISGVIPKPSELNLAMKGTRWPLPPLACLSSELLRPGSGPWLGRGSWEGDASPVPCHDEDCRLLCIRAYTGLGRVRGFRCLMYVDQESACQETRMDHPACSHDRGTGAGSAWIRKCG